MRKRILLTTFGSLGDLHPYMALALGLQARGHEVAIAASDVYRGKIERAGIGFHPVRPTLPPPKEAQETIARVMHPRRGPEYLFKHLLLPALRESYEDLTAAANGADILITHMITLAAPLVAERLSLPWVSCALQPSIFLSAFDPPLFGGAPWLAWAYRLGSAGARALLGIVRSVQTAWLAPVRRFRKELGLPSLAATDLDMQISPFLHLALFSRVLGSPQPDWPPQTRQAGFCFYDRLEEGQGLSKEIEEFLQAGTPPIVFTLGSSAVMNPGSFFNVSLEAARIAGGRALLLVGADPGNILNQRLPEGMLAAPYAPYSEVFPRCAAIVHQGGAGTTAQALRAGRPQLVVPFAYDQPDNAARVARAGAGSVLRLRSYNPHRASAELRALMTAPSSAECAEQLAGLVRSEEGVGTACDAIEEQLRTRS